MLKKEKKRQVEDSDGEDEDEPAEKTEKPKRKRKRTTKGESSTEGGQEDPYDFDSEAATGDEEDREYSACTIFPLTAGVGKITQLVKAPG